MEIPFVAKKVVNKLLVVFLKLQGGVQMSLCLEVRNRG